MRRLLGLFVHLVVGKVAFYFIQHVEGLQD